MTGLDESAQHDPAQERLARIAESVQFAENAALNNPHTAKFAAESLLTGTRDLLAFARDVLEIRRRSEVGHATRGWNSAVDEIRDAAAHHLTGDQT